MQKLDHRAQRSTGKSTGGNRDARGRKVRALEFHVSPQARHHYRPPVAGVAGVDDVLYAGSDIDSAPDVRCVIRFDDVLPPVVQLSIAQEKTVPAVCQIDLVILLDAVRHKGNAGTVLPAMPLRAIHPDALVEGRINFRVSK